MLSKEIIFFDTLIDFDIANRTISKWNFAGILFYLTFFSYEICKVSLNFRTKL